MPHRGRELLQLGIDAVLDACEEVRDSPYSVNGGLEFAEREYVYVVSGALERFQEGDCIDVTRCREILLEHQYHPHFIGGPQPHPYDARVGRNAFALDLFRGVHGQAPVCDGASYLVKAKFGFQSAVCRAVHFLLSSSSFCLPLISSFRVELLSTGVTSPALTKEIPPVCSDTTITSASLRSLMPTAALCRIP